MNPWNVAIKPASVFANKANGNNPPAAGFAVSNPRYDAPVPPINGLQPKAKAVKPASPAAAPAAAS